MRRVLLVLSSLWLTLAALVATALVLGWDMATARPVGIEVAVPLVVLFVNLVAAVATNPRLYRQPGLFFFHLGLAALALLVAMGRLVAFNGHVEITEGAALDPARIEGKAGPFHPWGARDLQMVQGPVTVAYLPGMKQRETRSQVAVPDGAGGWRQLDFGDDTPLVIGGYRFYVTGNKGFAPVLTYVDGSGRRHTGAVNLPSYPKFDFKQGNEFPLPEGDRKLTVWLDVPKPLYDEETAWKFIKPTGETLVVMDGDLRREVRQGDEVALATGRLRYDGLSTWMGYTVFYDPTLAWQVAAAVVAALGMAWHAAGRLRGLTSGPGWREVAHAP